MVAQVESKDVTNNQVVELITTGRSGSLGVKQEPIADGNGGGELR
jgi:hypothetical protein